MCIQSYTGTVAPLLDSRHFLSCRTRSRSTAGTMKRWRLVALLCALSMLYERVGAACKPRCDASNALPAVLAQLAQYSGYRQPLGPPASASCAPHMRSRGDALQTQGGSWVIIIGMSWLHATGYSLLQVRAWRLWVRRQGCR
jgi:hypothetical protein